MKKSIEHRRSAALPTAFLVFISSFLIHLHLVASGSDSHHQNHFCEECSLAIATTVGASAILLPEGPVPSVCAITMSLLPSVVFHTVSPTPRSGAPPAPALA
jgi:hypothetical protein